MSRSYLFLYRRQHCSRYPCSLSSHRHHYQYHHCSLPKSMSLCHHSQNLRSLLAHPHHCQIHQCRDMMYSLLLLLHRYGGHSLPDIQYSQYLRSLYLLHNHYQSCQRTHPMLHFQLQGMHSTCQTAYCNQDPHNPLDRQHHHQTNFYSISLVLAGHQRMDHLHYIHKAGSFGLDLPGSLPSCSLGHCSLFLLWCLNASFQSSNKHQGHYQYCQNTSLHLMIHFQVSMEHTGSHNHHNLRFL